MALVGKHPVLLGSFYFSLTLSIKPDEKPYALVEGLPRSPMHYVQLAPSDHPEPRYEAIIQYPISPNQLPLNLRVGIFVKRSVNVPLQVGYVEATLRATPEVLYPPPPLYRLPN